MEETSGKRKRKNPAPNRFSPANVNIAIDATEKLVNKTEDDIDENDNETSGETDDHDLLVENPGAEEDDNDSGMSDPPSSPPSTPQHETIVSKPLRTILPQTLLSKPRHPQPRQNTTPREESREVQRHSFQQQQQVQQKQLTKEQHQTEQKSYSSKVEPNNNDIKQSPDDEQVKFHQKLLEAQSKNTNEVLKTNVPGLLSPKLFSAEQVEAMQLLQAHQVQAQMQQVYQQMLQSQLAAQAAAGVNGVLDMFVESNQANGLRSHSPSSPPQRKRGRPRMDECDKRPRKSYYVPTGRPRGRPPKHLQEEYSKHQQHQTSPTSLVKRPPGRPRIHPPKEKRPRGRPRIHPVKGIHVRLDSPNDPNDKKPRGRPISNPKVLALQKINGQLEAHVVYLERKLAWKSQENIVLKKKLDETGVEVELPAEPNIPQPPPIMRLDSLLDENSSGGEMFPQPIVIEPHSPQEQFKGFQNSLQTQHKNQNGSSFDSDTFTPSPAKRFVFLNQDGTIRDTVDDRFENEQNASDTFPIRWGEDNYLDS